MLANMIQNRRRNLRRVKFTFKLAYTEQIKEYSFSKYVTIRNFIESIKNQAYNDFHINRNYQIELVECGQYNNINGRDPELAPAIIPEFNISLKDKYESINYNMAFYIRIINNNVLNNNNNGVVMENDIILNIENEEARLPEYAVSQNAS
jgi:hypothetical protein